MKKRIAFIGSILSLIPLGQTLLIKTVMVLSITGIIISNSEKVNAETANNYYQRGRKDFFKGDFYSAISNFDMAIKLDPDFGNVYVARCGAKLNLNINKGAVEDCQKAIAMNILDPSIYIDKHMALTNLCGAKGNLGDFYAAISDCNNAIKLNSKDRLTFRNRGLAKEKIGDLKGACSDWRQASILGDQDAKQWYEYQC
tara:strand:- start:1270 stop:1866 length:597 start_codon:yes stop_codon:yes gene_type:complete